jgi:hypothetical protein
MTRKVVINNLSEPDGDDQVLNPTPSKVNRTAKRSTTEHKR